MNFNKLTKTFLMFAACFFLLPAAAQVTIGSDEAPVKGAALQIKDRNGVLDEAENSSRGVIFPRVRLSQKDMLYPMFLQADGVTATTDYTSTADILAMNKSHAGMIVYNTYESLPSVTNPKLKFKKGLYVWTGTEWGSVATSEVKNGLSVDDVDGKIMLGGKLTDSTTIVVDAKDLVFDLKNIPDKTDKGLIIKGLETQSNSRAVVVDINTGKIGKSAVIPASLAFFQSGDENRTLTINTGAPQIVAWDIDDPECRSGKDWVTNNIVHWDKDNNAFIMQVEGDVEVSAMVGYIGGGWKAYNSNGDPIKTGTDPGGPDQVIVNATLQLQKAANAGTNIWEDFSSVRGVYTGASAYYRNTLSIPPAMMKAEVGDKIRLVVLRPPQEGSTNTYLGDDHQTKFGTYGEDDKRNPKRGIVRPYGTKFSKSLKIIVQ